MRLLFVDGLRGIAASAVVLTHLTSRTDLRDYFAIGHLGVAVFFVLSGYVIAMVIGSARPTAPYIARFAARRALRLDPPYWLSILVAVVLMAIATRMGLEKDFPSLGEVALHLIYLQDLAGISPISSVYWTLCLEIQFYLVLLLVVRTGYAVPVLMALAGLSITEQTGVTQLSPPGLFLPYWFAFAAGALVRWTSDRSSKPMLYGFLLILVASSFGKHGAWLLTTAITALALHVAGS
jgi:peptidoglycan/LPS O-acetylase OafA/YrhL